MRGAPSHYTVQCSTVQYCTLLYSVGERRSECICTVRVVATMPVPMLIVLVMSMGCTWSGSSVLRFGLFGAMHDSTVQYKSINLLALSVYITQRLVAVVGCRAG